jgi:hypothetical protein
MKSRVVRISIWVGTIVVSFALFPSLARDAVRGDGELIQVLVLSGWAAVLVCEGAAYVRHRFLAQRKQGLTLEEIAADGAKPTTGSVWTDAAIFMGVFAMAFAGFAYLVLRV